MATTPGKIKENDMNLDSKATSFGDASDMGKAQDLNRNWDREEKKTDVSGNVSSLNESRRTEGWQAQAEKTATDVASKVQDFAKDFGAQAKDYATNAGKKVQDLASNAADKTSDTIREYPLQSLLVGFGLGCVVGFLLPRK